MSPLPGRRNTRATAVLRRPVPKFCTSAATSYISCLLSDGFQCRGLLSLMRMLRTRVNFQLPVHLLAKLVLWQHARDSQLHHLDRPLGAHLRSAHFLQTTGIAGVMAIHLLPFLVAGQANLVGVQYDDVVTGIDIG